MIQAESESVFIVKEKGFGFNYSDFKRRHANKLLILSVLLFCLLLLSLFKNISYPLLWADESMTAMGTERVLQYGYPKVHDGKNVFYDLRHSNPRLGISENDDAYVGGAGWGQYYYGIIGYKLAEKTDDIYLKTGIFRATFGLAGLIGLLLLGYFVSRFFSDNFTKFAFFSLFLLLELTSVSLVLLLKEVRYYSLVMLLTSIIIGLYSSYRFYKPVNKFIFVSVESVSLWLLFVTFSPVFFIAVLSIGISEIIIWAYQFYKSDIISDTKKAIPIVLPVIISGAGIVPLLSYFKTFEISKAMNEFNGYSSQMYWENVVTAFTYFKNLELLLLAVSMKIFLMFIAKKLFIENNSMFKLSNFFTLFFIISVFTIAKVPNIIYTRYLIYLQPFLSIMIILDFFMLLKHYSISSFRFVNLKTAAPLFVFVVLLIYSVIINFQNIKGHVYEMSHIYKGPLDYTIPYIKENFVKTDTLVIAANYEETAYMYYLKSKVVVGFIGNNLMEDSQANPHIIAYRGAWQNFLPIFDAYLQKKRFAGISFPLYDFPVNNIAELNSEKSIHHQFETLAPVNRETSTALYIRQ